MCLRSVNPNLAHPHHSPLMRQLGLQWHVPCFVRIAPEQGASRTNTFLQLCLRVALEYCIGVQWWGKTRICFFLIAMQQSYQKVNKKPSPKCCSNNNAHLPHSKCLFPQLFGFSGETLFVFTKIVHQLHIINIYTHKKWFSPRVSTHSLYPHVVWNKNWKMMMQKKCNFQKVGDVQYI